MVCRISRVVRKSVEMVATLVFLLATVSSAVNGNSLEAMKPQYYADFFISSRIKGGDDAPQGYGKHMAALVSGYQWISLICGGTIITTRHILTAAHCINMVVTWDQELPASFHGIIGSKQWLSGTNQVQFLNYAVHPQWEFYTLKYDISLLYVATDIYPSDTVTIMPLRFAWVDGGMNTYVTGWGKREELEMEPEHKSLQLLYVETLNHNDCEQRLVVVADRVAPKLPLQEDIQICTLHSPGHGVCNGDSGSALVLEETQEQIGIVSWGLPCALGYPDVFVRISGFEDWLRYNTQGYLP